MFVYARRACLGHQVVTHLSENIQQSRSHDLVCAKDLGAFARLFLEQGLLTYPDMAAKSPFKASKILATPIENLEESRAQRLQRQQSRFRDRGG